MNWPVYSAVKKIDARQARKAAWDAEIAELRARKAERESVVKVLPVDGEDGYFVGIIQSDAFASMYEEMTGKNAGEWVRSVMKATHFTLNAAGMSRAQWIRSKVADLMAKYHWGDPACHGSIANRLVRSRDPHESRRLRIRLATPQWANPLKIAAIYRQRDRLTKETGVEHQVDHIVPLTHPRVCGLHWEGNMQIITAEENQKKSNKFHI